MAGEVRFMPSEADYIGASRANYLQQLRWWRTWRRLGLVALITIGAVAIVVGVLDRDWWGGLEVAVLMLPVLAVTIPICHGFNYVLLPHRCRRLFAQQKTLLGEQTLRWSGDSLDWSSATFSMHMLRSDYHCWTESKGMFLLYLNEQMPHFLPKRAFSEAEQADLRASLVACGPSRG